MYVVNTRAECTHNGVRTMTETKVQLSRQNKQKLSQTVGKGRILKVQIDETHIRKSRQAGVNGGSQVREKREEGTLPCEAWACEDYWCLSGRQNTLGRKNHDYVGPDLRGNTWEPQTTGPRDRSLKPAWVDRMSDG